MKYLIIKDSLESNNFDSIINFINENSEDQISFMLQSDGGEHMHTLFLLDIINSNPDRFTLTMSIGMSAAFLLFMKAKCSRKIIRGAIGMYHQGIRTSSRNLNGRTTYDHDEAYLKNDVNCKYKDDKVFAKKFMNKKEYRLYKKGRDVYFTFERMMEFLPKSVEVIL